MKLIAKGKINDGKLEFTDSSAVTSLIKSLQNSDVMVTIQPIEPTQTTKQTLMEYYEYTVKPFLLLHFIAQIGNTKVFTSEIDVDAFVRMNFAPTETKVVPIDGGSRYTELTMSIALSDATIHETLINLVAWLKARNLSLPKINHNAFKAE